VITALQQQQQQQQQQLPNYMGLPHGILHVLNTILYENEFQYPQILMDTLKITLVV
jgi:hypothetical protein